MSECAALGPLLGESQPQTLSTLVRGIATGKVRKFLEDHLPAPGTETQVRPAPVLCLPLTPSGDLVEFGANQIYIPHIPYLSLPPCS